MQNRSLSLWLGVCDSLQGEGDMNPAIIPEDNMNPDLVDDCRACGQNPSKDVQQNCPHCGEPDPHLTNEETMLDQEEKKQKRLDRIVGCFLWVFIAVIVFLLHFFVLRFLFPQKR